MQGRRFSLWLLSISLLLGAVSGSLNDPAAAAGGAGVTASPPSWHLARAASVHLRSAALDSVSCPTVGFCLAVGSDLSADVYAWNGRAWTVLANPAVPAGEAAAPAAVACTSENNCLVAGQYTNAATGLMRVLLWSWDGQSLMKESFPAGPPGSSAYLTALSCASATSCMGVGGTEANPLAPFRLGTWTFDGRTWSENTPPAGGHADATTVSCRSFGCFLPVSFGDGAARVYRWQSGQWSSVRLPVAAGVDSSFMEGIDCPTSSFCIVVGVTLQFSGGAIGTAVSYTWNGSKWASQPMVQQPRSIETEAEAVSCVSPSSCMAVASYETERKVEPKLLAVDETPMAEVWNGTKWRRLPVTAPTGAASAEFESVACTGGGRCLAVGEYSFEPGLTNSAFSERWDGDTWSLVSTPTPMAVIPTYLNSVDCVGPTNCEAVGGYVADQSVPVAETWDGKRWSLKSVPYQPYLSSPLLGISCSAVRSCEAVGYGAVLHTPDADGLTGNTWVSQHVPGPKFFFSSELSSVACPSIDACLATGAYASSLFSGALLYRWNGRTWQSLTPPALPPHESWVALNSVSCVSATSCVVVGAYVRSGRPGARPATAFWNGQTWTVKDLPAVSGAYATVPESVSCTSTSSCVVVGFYTRGERAYPITDIFDGARWVQVRAPEDPGAFRTELFDVSCSPVGYCMALGGSLSKATSSPTYYIEAWDTITWNPVRSPEKGASISGVSCVVARCTVVGNDVYGPFSASISVGARTVEQ